jgi:menaquinone-dependent protoporphyrinogen oxidase
MTVLVAYASKHGSTQEVAEAVAAALRERGLSVDVRPASGVKTVEPYEAVVLGGALYAGRWHGDARRFLDDHRGALAGRALAVFAMGPRTVDAREVSASRAQLDKALRRVPEVTPAGVAIFGGVLDPARLRFPFNRLPASDARDWHAIEAWSDEMAETFAGVADRV